MSAQAPEPGPDDEQAASSPEQTKPGIFTWTTSAGRTYTTAPDSHPL